MWLNGKIRSSPVVFLQHVTSNIFLSTTATVSLQSFPNWNRDIISRTLSLVDGICDWVHFVGFQEVSTLSTSNYVEYENKHLQRRRESTLWWYATFKTQFTTSSHTVKSEKALLVYLYCRTNRRTTRKLDWTNKRSIVWTRVKVLRKGVRLLSQGHWYI